MEPICWITSNPDLLGYVELPMGKEAIVSDFEDFAARVAHKAGNAPFVEVHYVVGVLHSIGAEVADIWAIGDCPVLLHVVQPQQDLAALVRLLLAESGEVAVAD
ncbi:hypothetical protein SLEP1_g50448 [Rubroshorea leprosula]|uniref:Uncharacterized protein n=1 Tax=Rubroshorea leprosula TaxID=152421 RepID=A0AAV5M011_9ROSI|nr:hypothetical protein SLEP1_g50448 [Rubroshorea leprosula]